MQPAVSCSSTSYNTLYKGIQSIVHLTVLGKAVLISALCWCFFQCELPPSSTLMWLLISGFSSSVCLSVCVRVDPSPMMPVDPVRVLCSPGQLEQEYKTEMRKVNGKFKVGLGF